jgi:hypothetical protein
MIAFKLQKKSQEDISPTPLTQARYFIRYTPIKVHIRRMFVTLKSQFFVTTRLLEYAELIKRIPNFLIFISLSSPTRSKELPGAKLQYKDSA